ncbi:MAG: outer membrane beta-barrel protein, partial [Aliifodinibius sp.]|nr:outer membrane beta-barrel protein [Fodinibius sp.]
MKISTLSIASLLILLLITTGLLGQVDQDSLKSSLIEDSWSLQFRISQDFTLSSFLGGNLSAKKHFSNKSAIRFGVSLSGETSEEEMTEELRNLLDKSSEDESEQDFVSLKISTQYLYYPNSHKPVNLFIGAGPFLEYSILDLNQQMEITQNDTTGRSQEIDRSVDSWGLGVLFAIGVEWFMTRNLSLLAEYGTSFSYRKMTREHTSEVIRQGGEKLI